MHTQTELQLQKIVKKIKSINELPDIGQQTDCQKDITIAILQEIGEIVDSMSEKFTKRHFTIFWSELKNLKNIKRNSMENEDEQRMSDAIKTLSDNSADLGKLAYPDKDIQTEVLSHMKFEFDLHTKELYGRDESLAVLISLTSMLFAIRAALVNIGLPLSLFQIVVYSLNIIPIIWIALDISKDHDRTWLEINPASNYCTYTDYYNVAYDIIEENIKLIIGILNRRRRIRKRQIKMWKRTALSSIIITVIALW